jgi:hypothetical protein
MTRPTAIRSDAAIMVLQALSRQSAPKEARHPALLFRKELPQAMRAIPAIFQRERLSPRNRTDSSSRKKTLKL